MKSALNYYPAQLYENKGNTYIGYYVRHPATGEMRRIRIKLNRIKTKKERRKYARELIIEINQKLASGWNPFLEQEAPRSFTTLDDTINVFLRVKEKELRPDSIRSYKSILKIFQKWANENKRQPVYILNLSNYDAKAYLNYLYIEKDKSERVFNNHRSMLKIFWNWLIENGYSKTNIFEGIKKKKERQKTRVFISREQREQIFNYFEKTNKRFLAICYLTFYGLIRPKEICHLKSSDIDFEKNIITIRAEASKTGKQRIISMPPKLKEILREIGADATVPVLFLFSGSKTFNPGKKLNNSRSIGKEWSKMREALGFDNTIQFYGLKDSGIIEMLRAGVSPEAVRDQAGHSSLEMTNKYVKLVRAEADEQIINKINF